MFYAGTCNEHLLQLIALRPYIEDELPGIILHIACRDNMFHLIKDEPRIHLQSKLVEQKRQFGYIREIRHDLSNNSIEAFLMESKLKKTLLYYYKELNPQPTIGKTS